MDELAAEFGLDAQSQDVFGSAAVATLPDESATASSGLGVPTITEPLPTASFDDIFADPLSPPPPSRRTIKLAAAAATTPLPSPTTLTSGATAAKPALGKTDVGTPMPGFKCATIHDAVFAFMHEPKLHSLPARQTALDNDHVDACLSMTLQHIQFDGLSHAKKLIGYEFGVVFHPSAAPFCLEGALAVINKHPNNIFALNKQFNMITLFPLVDGNHWRLLIVDSCPRPVWTKKGFKGCITFIDPKGWKVPTEIKAMITAAFPTFQFVDLHQQIQPDSDSVYCGLWIVFLAHRYFTYIMDATRLDKPYSIEDDVEEGEYVNLIDDPRPASHRLNAEYAETLYDHYIGYELRKLYEGLTCTTSRSRQLMELIQEYKQAPAEKKRKGESVATAVDSPPITTTSAGISCGSVTFSSSSSSSFSSSSSCSSASASSSSSTPLPTAGMSAEEHKFWSDAAETLSNDLTTTATTTTTTTTTVTDRSLATLTPTTTTTTTTTEAAAVTPLAPMSPPMPVGKRKSALSSATTSHRRNPFVIAAASRKTKPIDKDRVVVAALAAAAAAATVPAADDATPL